MNSTVTPQLSRVERWLWRAVTFGLLSLAAGLVAVGITLYV